MPQDVTRQAYGGQEHDLGVPVVTILVLAPHAQGRFFLAEGPAIGPVERFSDEGIATHGLGPGPVQPLLVAARLAWPGLAMASGGYPWPNHPGSA